MTKVFKNGNSLAVTVPKAYAHQLSIRDGSKIEWKQTEEGLLLVHEKKAKKTTSGITPEFMRWLDSFNKEYGPALKELAKK